MTHPSPTHRSSKSRRLTVLGLGNVLCSDDGVGPAAIGQLWRGWKPPASASVMDGGTLGMALVPTLESADDAILVDAVFLDDEPPGAPVRLEGDDIPQAVLHRLSPHQIGVADLLDSLRLLGRTPPRLILVGLVPASLSLGVELTPRVAAAMPSLVECIVAEADRLGHTFQRRSPDEITDPLATNPAAALGVFHGLGV